MTDPPIVDIHVHPDFKSYLSANEELNRADCWQDFRMDPLIQAIDSLRLGNILESQSNLTQLNNSSGTIAVVGLTAVEKAMIKADLINLVLFHLTLLRTAKILEITGNSDIVNYELFKRISRKRSRYFSVFDEMLSHLLLANLIPPDFNLLKNIRQYKDDKLNIILTIEGGHNLFRKNCGCRVRKGVFESLSDLKNGRHRYLFMSPSHVSRNRLCTHAFSMKILHHRNFKPVGRGITKMGREVILEALKQPHRILIDIKHMSLVSRQQYYNIRDRESITTNQKIPIISSHSGVTGISYQDRGTYMEYCRRCCRWTKVRWKQPRGLMDTRFNPWSINLYDEEIRKIVESDGLIGLSIDARILGARQQEPKDREEYFSRKEFRCSEQESHAIKQISMVHVEEPLTHDEQNVIRFETELNKRLVKYLKHLDKHPRSKEKYENDRLRILEDFEKLKNMKKALISSHLSNEDDIKYLCNNILHIVKVAGPTAWEHICIGSDFDGLVSSIECCRNVTNYDNLARELIHWLPLMSANVSSITHMTNINQEVQNIMSGNAYRFLQRYFT